MNTDELIRSLASELKPVRRVEAPARRWLFWMIGAALYAAATLTVMGVGSFWQVMAANPWLSLQCGLILISVLTASGAALNASDPLRSRGPWMGRIACASWLGWVILLAQRSVSEDRILSAGAACSAEIVCWAVLPSVLLFWLVRRGATLEREKASFFAMIAATGLGTWTQAFTCHDPHPMHVLVWHALPVLLLGVMSARFFSRRILKRI